MSKSPRGNEYISSKNSSSVGDIVERQLGDIEKKRHIEQQAKGHRQLAEDDLVRYLADQQYHEMLKLNYTEIKRQFT